MPHSTPFPIVLQKTMITIHGWANFKISQWGWVISWEDACSAAMRPWMKSLALNKPGMVVLTCHSTMDVETGGAEVLGHSWVHCDLTSAWTTGEMIQEKEEKKTEHAKDFHLRPGGRETLVIGLQHGGRSFSVVLTVSFCFVRGSGQHKSFFTVTWWPQQLINV